MQFSILSFSDSIFKRTKSISMLSIIPLYSITPINNQEWKREERKESPCTQTETEYRCPIKSHGRKVRREVWILKISYCSQKPSCTNKKESLCTQLNESYRCLIKSHGRKLRRGEEYVLGENVQLLTRTKFKEKHWTHFPQLRNSKLIWERFPLRYALIL